MIIGKRAALALAIPVALGGCMQPTPVEFNGHSVTMQTATPQAGDRQKAAIEAERICSKVGKRAEYASTSYVHDLNYRNLFLCI